jgi:hypothetical protein
MTYLSHNIATPLRADVIGDFHSIGSGTNLVIAIYSLAASLIYQYLVVNPNPACT